MASLRTCLLLFLSAATLASGGCREHTPPAAAAPEARPVRLVPIQVQPAPRTVEITGTLYGQEEVTIAAEVPGRITEIRADLGDTVAHASLLAQVDPTDYQLAVNEQQANLQAALAKLGLTETPTESLNVDQLPSVSRALAQAANARSRLDRASRLFDRTPPLLSEQDYADIQTQYEVADTSAAVERLNARAQLADVRVQAAALALSEQRLADTQILAPRELPLTYRVAARLVSVGEVVVAGQPLFRLVAADRIKFRGLAPERFAGQITPDAPADLMLDAFPEPFAAHVARIAPAVDIATRSFEVEIAAANPDGRLKPGSFARARILSSTDPAVRFVPAAAVVQFAGVQRIFSVTDGKIVEHRVTLGPIRDGLREIITPDQLPSRVIADARALSAGLPVVVMTDEASPAPDSPPTP